MFRDLKPLAAIDYRDGALWLVCGCRTAVVELKMGLRWPVITEAMIQHQCPKAIVASRARP